MTGTLKYEFKATATEIVDLGTDYGADPAIDWSLAVTRGTLKADSTLQCDELWSDQIALAAGAHTVDLTSLAKGNLPTLDLTGSKISFVRIQNPAGNAAMTFTAGASNGYDLFGASWSIVLSAGDEFMALVNSAPTVAAMAAEIDVAGTGTESFNILIAAHTP